MVGSKPSATLAGIKNGKVVFLTFVMSRARSWGITSIMYWLPASQVQPSGTNGLEMYFIPIAVVAGVSILGGTGRPHRHPHLHVLSLPLLQRACILWGLGNAWLYLTYGVVVLIAVLQLRY